MNEPFTIGVWRANPRQNFLESEGQRVRIDPKAMQVLVFLAERAGEDVSKDEILQEVWDGAFVSNEVLTNTIWELRKALGDDSRAPQFIQTIPRKGYCLIAPVAPVDDTTQRSRSFRLRGFFPPRAPNALLLSLIAIALIAVALVLRHDGPDNERTTPTVRLEWSLPNGQSIEQTGYAIALSSDGNHLLYRASTDAGVMLYHRPLGEFEVRAVPATEGVREFSLSPDGRWVAFWSPSRLSRVPLDGGPALTIAEPIVVKGPVWGPDDMIYYTAQGTTGDSGLMRISVHGGEPEKVTELDDSTGEWTHRYPDVLPGGKAVIFTIGDAAALDVDLDGWLRAKIGAVSLDTGERRTLIEGSWFARYVDGYLLYVTEGGTLRAAPFDREKLEITGESQTVVDRVLWSSDSGEAHFATSSARTLVYATGPTFGEAPVAMLRTERTGKAAPITNERRAFRDPALSPDEQRLALAIVRSGNIDIWIYDTTRDSLTRLTHESGLENHPIWTPDGRNVTYRFTSPRPTRVFSVPANGSGAPAPLIEGKYDRFPDSWSPDGQLLVVSERNPVTGLDLLVFDTVSSQAQPLLVTKFNESNGIVSPDGKWLAYVSDASGRDEIYATSFPSATEKWQISTGGGSLPSWTRNGRELVYRNEDMWMSVAVETNGGFVTDKPRLLFRGDYKDRYAVTADGGRFIVVENLEPIRQIHVVMNWLQELEGKDGVPWR